MEKQIQAAIAVGSHREALTLIARAYDAALLRFCYGLVGSESEAEELLQDTFTQITISPITQFNSFATAG